MSKSKALQTWVKLSVVKATGTINYRCARPGCPGRQTVTGCKTTTETACDHSIEPVYEVVTEEDGAKFMAAFQEVIDKGRVKKKNVPIHDVLYPFLDKRSADGPSIKDTVNEIAFRVCKDIGAGNFRAGNTYHRYAQCACLSAATHAIRDEPIQPGQAQCACYSLDADRFPFLLRDKLYDAYFARNNKDVKKDRVHLKAKAKREQNLKTYGKEDLRGNVRKELPPDFLKVHNEVLHPDKPLDEQAAKELPDAKRRQFIREYEARSDAALAARMEAEKQRLSEKAARKWKSLKDLRDLDPEFNEAYHRKGQERYQFRKKRRLEKEEEETTTTTVPNYKAEKRDWLATLSHQALCELSAAYFSPQLGDNPDLDRFESCLALKFTDCHASDLRRQEPSGGHTFSLADFVRLVVLPCVYCGALPQFGNLSTLDRIVADGPYTEENVCPACIRCNVMRGNAPQEVFVRHVEAIVDWQNHQRPNPVSKVAHPTNFDAFRASAGKNGNKVMITETQRHNIIALSCVYCGYGPANGIDRINNNLRQYSDGNCVPCCSRCNYMKRDQSLGQFLVHCAKIGQFQSSLTAPSIQ